MTEVMYHVGRPGARRLHGPRPAGLGRRRPQQPHERVLGVRTARLHARGPVTTDRHPTTRTPSSSCCSARTSRPATTSTRTRSASWRRRCAARRSRSATSGCRTPRAWPTGGWRRARAPRPRCCSASRTSSSRRVCRTTRSSVAGSTGVAGSPRTIARAAATRTFVAALRQHYTWATPDAVAEICGLDAETVASVGRAIGRAGHAFAATSGATPRVATRVAGRSRGALALLTSLCGAVGTVGGTNPNGWNKFAAKPFAVAAAAEGVERAALPARVAARAPRAVVPAAAPA